MLRVFFLLALCACAALSQPVVVGGIKMPAAPPTDKIYIPDLKLPNPDTVYMSSKTPVPASWGPFGPDAAVGAVAPTKTSPTSLGKAGAFDLLLATLSNVVYNGIPKEGSYINLPWTDGCTTLQVYRNLKPANQEMTLLTWPAQKSLVFVFRGTANFDNVITDIKGLLVKCSMGPASNPGHCGRIHKGFNELYMKYKDELVTLFKNALSDTGFSDALYITGHSMGCVIANYMAYQVASAYPTTFKRVYTSGIGCPAVGDSDFKAAFDTVYKHQYFMRYTAHLDMGDAIKEDVKKVGAAIKGAAGKVANFFGKKMMVQVKSAKKGRAQALLQAGAKQDDIITEIARLIPGYVHVGDNIEVNCKNGGSCNVINPASLHHSYGYQEMIRRFHGLPAYSAKCGYSIDAEGKTNFLPVADPLSKV